MRKKKVYQWLESSVTFIFSLFSLRTFEAAQHEKSKNLPSSRPTKLSRNSLKILKSYSVFFFGVLVPLLFGKCSYMFVKVPLQILRLKQKKNKTKQNKTKNQAHSVKFEKTGIGTLFLDMATRVTYEKYATRFPGRSDRIDSMSDLVLGRTLTCV